MAMVVVVMVVMVVAVVVMLLMLDGTAPWVVGLSGTVLESVRQSEYTGHCPTPTATELVTNNTIVETPE
jgi:hypothetical protein